MTDVTGMFSLPLISSMDLPAMFFGLSLVTSGETSEDNPYVFTDNDGCGRKLGAAFASSYAMMKLITTNIARASWEKDSYTFNETFDPYPYDYHGPDEELSLSVGEANISITISRTGDNMYYVSYTVSDSYTFEDWETSKSGLFAKVSNNAGYILARIGTVKPYYWTYTGSFYYFPQLLTRIVRVRMF